MSLMEWVDGPGLGSLALVLALGNAFQDRKTGLFRVGNGKWLENARRAETREHLPNRSPASRALLEFGGRQRTTQSEAPGAGSTGAFAEFIFVEGHASGLVLQVRWRATHRPASPDPSRSGPDVRRRPALTQHMRGALQRPASETPTDGRSFDARFENQNGRLPCPIASAIYPAALASGS